LLRYFQEVDDLRLICAIVKYNPLQKSFCWRSLNTDPEGDPHFLCESFCLAKRPSFVSWSILVGIFSGSKKSERWTFCALWVDYNLTYLDRFASVSTISLVCKTEQLGMIGHSE